MLCKKRCIDIHNTGNRYICKLIPCIHFMHTGFLRSTRRSHKVKWLSWMCRLVGLQQSFGGGAPNYDWMRVTVHRYTSGACTFCMEPPSRVDTLHTSIVDMCYRVIQLPDIRKVLVGTSQRIRAPVGVRRTIRPSSRAISMIRDTCHVSSSITRGLKLELRWPDPVLQHAWRSLFNVSTLHCFSQYCGIMSGHPHQADGSGFYLHTSASCHV